MVLFDLLSAIVISIFIFIDFIIRPHGRKHVKFIVLKCVFWLKDHSFREVYDRSIDLIYQIQIIIFGNILSIRFFSSYFIISLMITSITYINFKIHVGPDMEFFKLSTLAIYFIIGWIPFGLALHAVRYMYTHYYSLKKVVVDIFNVVMLLVSIIFFVVINYPTSEYVAKHFGPSSINYPLIIFKATQQKVECAPHVDPKECIKALLAEEFGDAIAYAVGNAYAYAEIT